MLENIKKGFVHAFALDVEKDIFDKEKLPESLERFARAVVDRKMETVTLLFLESMIPVSFLLGQVGYAFLPFLRMLGIFKDADDIVKSLNNRHAGRLLAQRIRTLSRLVHNEIK